jgi:hypothetical protein
MGAATHEHHENAPSPTAENLVYDDEDVEPELHLRTYVALAAMWLLNWIQVVALQGPPSMVHLHT